MKSNAPWSVKGIERDARETAKEAAKREGMTVGEWLNQMIYAAGDPEASGGEVEGLKLRDIVTAIDHLNKRIADGANESKDAVGELTRKMGDVVERVQRLERSPGGGGDRERVDALKALEKAVAQVAVQFSNAQKTTVERLETTERQIEKLAERVENAGDANDGASDVGFLKDAIDGLQTRMSRTERIANEALHSGSGGGASSDFVETTGNRLRILGDEIKRGGDQIRALETMIGKLSQQIEAAERRSAEGLQKTAETLSELREKFSGESFDAPNKDDIAALVAAQTRDTVERVDLLQASLEKMLDRLNDVEDGAEDSDEPLVMKKKPADETITLGGPDEAEAAAEPPATATQEPPPAETGASDVRGEEENDDDFFSFADDIDASIEEKPAETSDEDFSFELEDEPEEADEEGAALLSEVQEAFSGAGEKAKPKTEPEPEDSDLDELLAGLDDVAAEPAPSPAEETSEEEPDAPPMAEAKKPAAGDDHSEDGEDLLTSIRRKAKETAAAQAAQDGAARRTKRKLTPKQRAILAARARRKKLAAAAGEKAAAPDDAPKREAAKQALAAAGADHHDAQEPHPEDRSDAKDKSASPKLAGAVGALRAKLPFLGGKKKDLSDEDDGDDIDEDRHGDRAALETLKTTASAKPVTLALGVGIFLAVGLLFFMIRDLIFAPRDSAPPQTAQTTQQDGAQQTASIAEPAIEAPAAPAIDPRVLYQDAVTGLNAANNEAETAMAVEKLEQAALLGHPPAQLQLGELYKTGQGVDLDLAQARTWFRRAANGGNVLAMHRAGVMTARGEGGEANTPEAIGWFEQAANRGLVDSQYNLGAIYHPSGENGAAEGIQDAGKAYYWYSLAAKNGDEQAEPLAAGVGALMSDNQRAEIDEAVAAWEALPSDAEANTLAATG